MAVVVALVLAPAAHAAGATSVVMLSNSGDYIGGGVPRIYLSGARGDDDIHGGAGSDTVRGGPGRDVIDCGRGPRRRRPLSQLRDARPALAGPRLAAPPGRNDRVAQDTDALDARLEGIAGMERPRGIHELPATPGRAGEDQVAGIQREAA